MRACRPMWYMCQRASMPVPFKCQRTRSMSTFHLYVLTFEPAIRPTNIRNGMPIFQLDMQIFQLGMPTCQKMCLFFKHSSYEMLKEISILYYWMLSVSPTASYEITLIRLSVCLSCRQSQSFLKIGSLFFSDIVHDDNWLRYLVTDGARFLKKKVLAAWIHAKWFKIRPETRVFVIFSSLVHLFSLKLYTMIACNNV